jgi:hypothetical protein
VAQVALVGHDLERPAGPRRTAGRERSPQSGRPTAGQVSSRPIRRRPPRRSSAHDPARRRSRASRLRATPPSKRRAPRQRDQRNAAPAGDRVAARTSLPPCSPSIPILSGTRTPRLCGGALHSVCVCAPDERVCLARRRRELQRGPTEVLVFPSIAPRLRWRAHG